jgi:hypothetical protein
MGQWLAATSRVLSAQQELGDTGTAHGDDMRDIDHKTCKSPTGNVSTNHLCPPRANFGYMGKLLGTGSLFDGCLPGGFVRAKKSEEVGITQSRRRQLDGKREQRRCRRLELDGFGRALFEEGSCG